jgi:prefoldin subunit 5
MSLEKKFINGLPYFREGPNEDWVLLTPEELDHQIKIRQQQIAVLQAKINHINKRLKNNRDNIDGLKKTIDNIERALA